MKTTIAVAVLSLCPSILFSQSKQADTTTVAKMKEADTTVFGIHLGEKLSIPECKRAKYPVGNSPYDLVNTSAVRCFWRNDAGTVKPNAPVVTTELTILFPTKDQPGSLFPLDLIYGVRLWTKTLNMSLFPHVDWTVRTQRWQCSRRNTVNLRASLKSIRKISLGRFSLPILLSGPSSLI